MGWGYVGPINLEFYYSSVNGGNVFLFLFFFTQQIHPAVLKTGHRHGLEIGGHEEYIKNQFAPACSNAGEDEVHYLNDEYIPKIALLQAFWNANISAQSKGEKITKKKRHKTSLTDSHLQGSG